jgi:hypothetical protein
MLAGTATQFKLNGYVEKLFSPAPGSGPLLSLSLSQQGLLPAASIGCCQ